MNSYAFYAILSALGLDAFAIGLHLCTVRSGASALDVVFQSVRLGALAVHLNSWGVQVTRALWSCAHLVALTFEKIAVK